MRPLVILYYSLRVTAIFTASVWQLSAVLTTKELMLPISPELYRIGYLISLFLKCCKILVW